jgi:hypothetical protein
MALISAGRFSVAAVYLWLSPAAIRNPQSAIDCAINWRRACVV